MFFEHAHRLFGGYFDDVLHLFNKSLRVRHRRDTGDTWFLGISKNADCRQMKTIATSITPPPTPPTITTTNVIIIIIINNNNNVVDDDRRVTYRLDLFASN